MSFWTITLYLSIPMFAAAGFLGALGAYDMFLAKFFSEVQEEETSFLKAFRQVALRQLGTFNRRFMWPSYEAKTRRRLIKAGEPAQLRPEEVMAMQEIGFVLGLIAGLVIGNAMDYLVVGMLLGALLGLYYPQMWLNDQIKKRHHLITRALPYNLDLLTLSVEAGLDFTGALGKVVEKGKTGPLREEFQMVLKQLKMGKTREEALKMMVARVDLPALTSFVTALIQADKMGTSLGKVLRIQSTQLRIERTQKAEKMANEAPVKMLFPLIACIFPTVFMVLFGPIVFAFSFGNNFN
ncbi:MAG: type II secretion system F family protein [Deltaproteobacteria bacterium]|nr:type II secretion system F family protein [Deltaproteobacteria bacterium]